MALPEPNIELFNHCETRMQPRLADGSEPTVLSPVHMLHEELRALAETGESDGEHKYPGWFRLSFPIITSVSLWACLAGILGLLD